MIQEDTFEELREKILETWARPKGLLKPENYQAQSMKVVEELGETFGAILKGNKGDVVDGIGDIFVTLIILAEQLDVHPTTCLAWAWEEIKNRTGKMVDGVFIKD
jgi:NTP pyrophosphatase (non-canonical NTP hydrolase)